MSKGITKGFAGNRQAMTKREMQDNIQSRSQFAVNTALQAIQNVRQLSHTIQGLANTLRAKEVSEAAQNGDTLLLDYLGQNINEDGSLGSTFKGGTDYGVAVELGSGKFIPGFESELVGLKAGETKSFQVTFPKEYNPELAGKTVSFFVQVIKVYRDEVGAVELLQKKLDGEAAERQKAESSKEEVKA